MTGPKGNHEFCFPETLSAEGNIQFEEVEVHVVPLLIIFDQKVYPVLIINNK